MKFFFADSLDVVDPSFDFTTEQRSGTRVRQRDDQYPHEVFAEAPYDGILVSKAIVDGTGRAVSGKYTLAQRHRLLRVGIREFFRLDAPRPDGRPRTERLQTMGDCGAFTYVRDEVPPYTVDEVIDFYDACGFDYGVAIDHVILAFQPDDDEPVLALGHGEADLVAPHRRRQEITLDLALRFLAAHRRRQCRFTPIGVAQGWSPGSYRFAVEQLQRIGYDHIAIGGLVPLKTPEIKSVLAAVCPTVRPGTQVHLFGVTRVTHVRAFADFGVTSFDSTSPLRQAFKDDKDNYYLPSGVHQMAIRVPQVDGNPKLKKAIVAGQVDQATARRLERACLDVLARFDRGGADVDEVMVSLAAYERLHDPYTDRSDRYRAILEDRAWKRCPCEVCRALGIHVMLFRGAERNRRRGFHNLYVFERRLRGEMADAAGQRPATMPPVVHLPRPAESDPEPVGPAVLAAEAERRAAEYEGLGDIYQGQRQPGRLYSAGQAANLWPAADPHPSAVPPGDDDNSF